MGFASYVNKLTDNDEWYTPEEAVKIILPLIPDNVKTIWCPFDKPESEFVKVFTTGGAFRNLFTHRGRKRLLPV
jgi:hypothetical protein